MNSEIKVLSEKNDFLVCIKPAGIISEDIPGGLPERLKNELKYDGSIYAVHRLDKATSGLMVYAGTKETAAVLSKEIAEKRFQKEYLAVIHGCPEEQCGMYRDFLFHDTKTNKTYVAKKERKGTKEAVLEYEVLERKNDLSLVRIRLLTGRTHQIRVQFASRQMPLYGDVRYGAGEKAELALWSHRLIFLDEDISAYPERKKPWDMFEFGENT